MFRSKKDVDRHVQEILRKVKTEHEVRHFVTFEVELTKLIRFAPF